MDLEDIKRGLRAEIKKRENEQYLTFQCDVRQMCKDVLAKLEEQESEIAELKNKLRHYPIMVAMIESDKLEIARDKHKIRHHKYKRCLAMAKWCELKRIDAADDRIPIKKWDFYGKWHKCWLIIAEHLKEAK